MEAVLKTSSMLIIHEKGGCQVIVGKIWEDSEEERPKEIILINEDQTESVALGYVSVDSGQSTHTGFHNDEEEIYVILKGGAVLMIGDEKKEVGPGSVAYIPRNHKHKMTSVTEEKLEYLYFANKPGKAIKDEKIQY